MKKQLLLVIIIAFGIQAYSQTKFESGYFINDQGQKVECLIENQDWKSTPNHFTYKLNENSPRETASIENVQEFAFGSTKFERHTVERDISSTEINALGLDKRPKFLKETIFLNVLLEGEATLYSFTSGGKTLYFYHVDNKENVEQLIYKKYRPQPNQIAENNRFRQQLWTDAQCEDISMNEVMRVDYQRRDLLNYFEKYNTCKNSQYTSYIEKNTSKFDFNLSVRPGVNFTTAYVHGERYTVDFPSQTTFRIGAEFEIVLPFNNNKWAATIETSYQYFKDTKEMERRSGGSPYLDQNGSLTATMDYKSIAGIFGIRHYFFLNDSSKLFVNANYAVDFPFDAPVLLESFSLGYKNSDYLALGAGYNLNDKYSIEIRKNFKRQFTNLAIYDSALESFSFILGYNFL